jgi:nitroreductase
MLREAPLCIVVCAEPAKQIATDGYWIQDCSAATQNILLAATDLGLGSCWLGLHPSEGRPEAMRDLLGTPDTIIPMAAIALGHPAETQPPSERYDAERVHWEGW